MQMETSTCREAVGREGWEVVLNAVCGKGRRIHISTLYILLVNNQLNLRKLLARRNATVLSNLRYSPVLWDPVAKTGNIE